MKVLVLFPGEKKVVKMTAQEVYDAFKNNGQVPVSGHKYKVGDGYGHSSTICRNDEILHKSLNNFPIKTVFKVQYHPAGIEFNPQIKCKSEIERFQKFVSNF